MLINNHAQSVDNVSVCYLLSNNGVGDKHNFIPVMALSCYIPIPLSIINREKYFQDCNLIFVYHTMNLNEITSDMKDPHKSDTPYSVSISQAVKASKARISRNYLRKNKHVT